VADVPIATVRPAGWVARPFVSRTRMAEHRRAEPAGEQPHEGAGRTGGQESRMQVLVAYASRHGATRGIAERIAETLRAAGLDAQARPAASVKDVGGYDAFVVGSAAYMFKWLGEASAFVRRHRSILAARPLWLFSSGPVGEPVDVQGRDQKVAAIPRGIPELAAELGARGHHVFFGAYERDRPAIGFAERFMTLLPAKMEGLPEGDFRDWPEIEAWAAGIAEALAAVPRA
jgi:menaquinone-dependent protoporphyrinogen oxidase